MILSPPEISYINVFGFHLRYYSLCIFAAILASFSCLVFLVKKRLLKTSLSVVFDFTPLLIVFSVLGARLYYVLLSLDYFVSNPASIFMIWKGGISIHGAIIAGIVFGFVYFKMKKIKSLPFFDSYSLVLPLGQAIGRFGNFFNQEAFGTPVNVDFPFKLYVSPYYRPDLYAQNEYFHPVFLYESLFDFLIFVILLLIKKKTADKFDGLIFFIYILLYSFVRLFLEFLRLDTVFFFFGLPFPVVVSLIGILIGIFGLAFILKKN